MTRKLLKVLSASGPVSSADSKSAVKIVTSFLYLYLPSMQARDAGWGNALATTKNTKRSDNAIRSPPQ